MDWTAFGIAALGIVGTLVSPLVAHWLEGFRQEQADEREDLATLRLKLEETYSELDRLQGLANIASVATIRIANGEKDVPPVAPFDISRVRVNIGLYFPECAEALRQYDTEIEKSSQKLREEIEADPVNSVAAYGLLSFASYGKLAAVLRKELDARAAEILISPKSLTLTRDSAR